MFFVILSILVRSKIYLIFLFWSACGIVFILNDSHHIIWLRPQSVHVWRQTDCVSYALNYYQNNQPFFEPQTQTLWGENGHTTSEFPIIYYIAGKLYHVFGQKEAIIRIINFSLFLLGCTCLWGMCLNLFNNKWLAFVPPLITFTSPYLYYYGLNFLPDVPALSLALVGWFLSFRYFHSKKIWYLYLAAFAFCLGALLKISAGISFAALLGLVAIDILSGKERILKKSHRLQFVVLSFLVIAINFSWIQFARYYNELNHTTQNLLGLYPIWDADAWEIGAIRKRFGAEWLPVILHPFTWGWAGMLALLLLWKWKRLDFHIGVITALTVAGSVVYSLLWFRAYYHHDYYMINPFIGIVWILVAACSIIDKAEPGFRKWFALLIIPVLFLSAKQGRKIQLDRYYAPEFKCVNEAYFTIEPYLRSIGISRHDIVYSVPDHSPNVTLYYLNQQGWTSGTKENPDFKKIVGRGIKYFITSDTSYIHAPSFASNIGSLVGSYKGIYIYKVVQ